VPEYTVYTWGRGNDNVEVLPMDRLGLKQVECSANHNIGLTDMGEVMTWGSFSGKHMVILSNLHFMFVIICLIFLYQVLS